MPRSNHLLTTAAELSVLGVGLWVTMNLSPFATVPLALVVMLLGLFAAITGRGLPRLRGRVKGAAVFIVAGVFAVAASQAYPFTCSMMSGNSCWRAISRSAAKKS